MPNSRPERIDGLTHRQWQVWRLLAEGWQDKEIAHALGLVDGTVKSHLYDLRDHVGRYFGVPQHRLQRVRLALLYLDRCSLDERAELLSAARIGARANAPEVTRNPLGGAIVTTLLR